MQHLYGFQGSFDIWLTFYLLSCEINQLSSGAKRKRIQKTVPLYRACKYNKTPLRVVSWFHTQVCNQISSISRCSIYIDLKNIFISLLRNLLYEKIRLTFLRFFFIQLYHKIKLYNNTLAWSWISRNESDVTRHCKFWLKIQQSQTLNLQVRWQKALLLSFKFSRLA